jgi:hypothetical protein
MPFAFPPESVFAFVGILSIPAQLRLLRDYAETKGFAIAQEFTDVETAKASGRTNFTICSCI